VPRNTVNPLWNQITTGGYANAVNGRWTATAPFSREEYAKLPDNVLPTQEDVSKGLFDPSAVPFTRFRTGATDSTSNIPNTINLGSDRGTIEQEAAREQGQSMNVLGQQRDIRQGVLSGLMPILQQQADAQFKYDLPDIKEGLQANGVFTSDSAMANAVAREKANLLAPQLSALAQYGIGANDQYASGLGSILGQQQGLQQGGLQRQFSVNDFNRQADLARQIGASSVPQMSGGSGFTGALTGGLTGAGALSSLGPWGAAAGGVLGAVGGASASKGGGK
jgi:hypothetical protein